MRPVSFEYHRAETLDHAFELLAELGDEARPLAGGYSLVPMMNLRLARPMHVVDITGLDLDEVSADGGVVRFGALVRHARLLSDEVVGGALPLFREAAHHIAHPTIRNRGTLGGSLAHADPTAELALMAVLHDARVRAASREGERSIAARDFFKGAFMTALEPGEMVVGLDVPAPAQTGVGGAFYEFSERHGDFAIAAVGVLVEARNGTVASARVASAGATPVPTRVDDVEAFLSGQTLDAPDAEEAGRMVAAACDPPDEIRASSAYRKHLIQELTARAVRTACARVGGSR